jgi:hypothetical protein
MAEVRSEGFNKPVNRQLGRTALQQFVYTFDYTPLELGLGWLHANLFYFKFRSL